MQINFIPIPPDTYSSISQKLLEEAKKHELNEYFESGSVFGSIVSAHLDYEDEKVKAFIEWAKEFCEVKAKL